VNGLIFMGLGAFVLIECILRFGMRWQGISAYVLSLALIGLGFTRVRAGWPRSDMS
jgi:hypothetical protein